MDRCRNCGHAARQPVFIGVQGMELGDRRVVEGFLYLPKWLGGKWRWLRRAKWVEVARHELISDNRVMTLVWEAEKWLGDDE